MASRVVPFPVPAPAQASLSLSPDPDDDDTTDAEERRGVKSTSGTLEEGNAQAFPRRGVRLAWLRRFVDACKQKKYTWTAKDFLKAEHGGGADDVLQVTTDNLQEHRTRMNAAGKDGDGKPTTVQYNDIPFELMTTNDVCFGMTSTLDFSSPSCTSRLKMRARRVCAAPSSTSYSLSRCHRQECCFHHERCGRRFSSSNAKDVPPRSMQLQLLNPQLLVL